MPRERRGRRRRLTAAEGGALLVTRDERAARVCERLSIPFELVG